MGHCFAIGMQSRALSTRKEFYLLTNLSFVHGAEGDGETSHSYARTKGSIDTYSSSLEAQMARCFMKLVCEVAHFTRRKIYLPANLSFVHDS